MFKYLSVWALKKIKKNAEPVKKNAEHVQMFKKNI